jgi:hypothetical protein
MKFLCGLHALVDLKVEAFLSNYCAGFEIRWNANQADFTEIQLLQNPAVLKSSINERTLSVLKYPLDS